MEKLKKTGMRVAELYSEVLKIVLLQRPECAGREGVEIYVGNEVIR